MQQVSQGFKASYGKSLTDTVNSEVSGDFGSLCLSLCLSLAEFDATCINKAIDGMGTDEDALVETLCGRSNAEIYAIKQAYGLKFRRDLEREVANDLSGHMKRLFVAMVQGQRDETGQILNVDADVEALYKAGAGKMGTDESTFIMIFCTRSDRHLVAVFDAYTQKHNKTMDKVIKSEFSGDMEKALLAMFRSIQNRPHFLADCFEKSMAGLGTKDSKLIRLTVRCRHPQLMAQVKQAYLARYGKSLHKRVDGETSGDYRKLLLTIIGQ